MFARGIQGTGRIPREPTRRGSRAVADFRLPEAAAAESMAGAGPLAAATALDLQQAQAPDSSAARDAAVAAQSEAALEGFGALQIALLGGRGGGLDRARLADIAALPEPSDPRLAEVAAAIRLRARIELARPAADCLSSD